LSAGVFGTILPTPIFHAVSLSLEKPPQTGVWFRLDRTSRHHAQR
jgi:hypothetical protein